MDLSVNIDEGVYLCHSEKCKWSGTVKAKRQERVYRRPVWENRTILDDGIVKWFISRGISQTTVVENHIYNTGDWIYFPFFKNGEVLNIQKRTIDKQFRMAPDCELLFYNYDAFKSSDFIIIVEGQMDALSFLESGIHNVVSVPNGASTGNMDYLSSAAEDIDKIGKVYLACDNDEPGIKLRNELARRIGIDKCWLIDFKDCKDANEYLVKYGKLALADVVDKAVPYPIDGVFRVEDIDGEIELMYNGGLGQGALLDIEDMDKYISFAPGYLTIIHGIPTHGKSSFLDMMMVKLNLVNGWKFGVFSPENRPMAYHFSVIAEKLIGKRFFGHYKMSREELDMAKTYINSNFFFIGAEKSKTLDVVLDKARLLVLKYGVNSIAIDPYNFFQRPKSMDKEEYIQWFLNSLLEFAGKYGVHVFLVCHPTKIPKKVGESKYEIPVMYNIADSHLFYDKADIGICVYRDEDTQIHIQKRKLKHWGIEDIQDAVLFKWNKNSGRYYTMLEDNSNWLAPENLKQIEEKLPF